MGRALGRAPPPLGRPSGAAPPAQAAVALPLLSQAAGPLPPSRDVNEKVNWRIIHDRRDRLAWTCDKIRVKEFANRLGIDVPRTIWTGTDLDEIALLRLPAAWVLKPNNRSGLVMFGNGPTPHLEEIRRTVDSWTADARVIAKGEWAYTQADPGLVLEERIGPMPGSPTDYKVYAFDGEPHMILVDVDRFGRHRRTRSTHRTGGPWHSATGCRCWESSPGRQGWTPCSGRLDRWPPSSTSCALTSTSRLATSTSGELTPYPGGGLEPMKPRSADHELGRLWRLPVTGTS